MTLLARIWGLCVVLVLALAMSSPADAQTAGKPRVYLLRGLANIFSLGMDDLAAKLNARGIKATVHSYADWQAVSAAAVAEAKAGKRRPSTVVIIGHSLGADAAVYMGNRVTGEGVPVPLVVTFDPVTPTTASAAIGKVVNYYVASGSGKPVAGPKVQNINMASDSKVGHFNIDKLAALHEKVIAMIDRPAPRPRRPRPAATVPPVATPAAPATPSAAPAAAAVPAGAAPSSGSATETAAVPAAARAPN
ncbi:hypothetical protein [Ancylobacter oerskovii]|uniref:Thioesterase domain-containing protein n=1 Tax=Ancylobacter oerskovii TaxID=459519 RepID=A0ABW4YUZ5_9HYPH|nr:hypothetical protein [Ancylobacter oerskovii]MBS7544581.1 hypothetical protein [Ancylobacter oerskovii]